MREIKIACRDLLLVLLIVFIPTFIVVGCGMGSERITRERQEKNDKQTKAIKPFVGKKIKAARGMFAGTGVEIQFEDGSIVLITAERRLEVREDDY